ncbi:FecR family protein [Aquisediminimonas sediminicola]|uniref:FecR family protein n=1 Tax=Alteraquisediminimonas sediminicola TaxID=2676787 RepID=UPI001C8D1741|nr:FecR domain-containing protein [Aquisediminimonas sediminicola]
MSISQQILDSAAEWHVRLEGDAPDYDGFAAWLEADPLHRPAYDQVIALDILVDQHLASMADVVTLLPTPAPTAPSKPIAANDDMPMIPLWRRAGVAAAVAVLVGSASLLVSNPWSSRIEVETGRGESRVVQLADASNIALDGNSRITYADDNPRSIELAQGSAMFTVKHDAAHPFNVSAGAYQIHDLGTEFAVSRGHGHLTISVASGSVDITGPGMARLKALPGDRIDVAEEGGQARIERFKVDPDSVASWRNGRLIYDNIPLRLVVADINRYAPNRITVVPQHAERRFSGVLTIGDGSQLAPNLANLMDLPLDEQGRDARLGAGNMP